MQDETVDSDWQSNIKILKEYNEYREGLPEMIEKFQIMSDGPTTTYRSELTAPYIWTIHSVLYRAGLKVWESKEWNGLNAEGNLHEPAQT